MRNHSFAATELDLIFARVGFALALCLAASCTSGPWDFQNAPQAPIPPCNDASDHPEITKDLDRNPSFSCSRCYQITAYCDAAEETHYKCYCDQSPDIWHCMSWGSELYSMRSSMPDFFVCPP